MPRKENKEEYRYLSRDAIRFHPPLEQFANMGIVIKHPVKYPNIPPLLEIDKAPEKIKALCDMFLESNEKYYRIADKDGWVQEGIDEIHGAEGTILIELCYYLGWTCTMPLDEQEEEPDPNALTSEELRECGVLNFMLSECPFRNAIKIDQYDTKTGLSYTRLMKFTDLKQYLEYLLETMVIPERCYAIARINTVCNRQITDKRIFMDIWTDRDIDREWVDHILTIWDKFQKQQNQDEGQ